ncbi:aldo-keto reductase family 1 member A1-like [Bemisia tabaci]|uniref:aldo-keto reductase family 1 member A1-like n=1 Tax=Bemisia tabaci TaxID=7038 RepID=UPI003B283A94
MLLNAQVFIKKNHGRKRGKREAIFITSKLSFHANRPCSVEKYLTRSLKDLGLEYVDMYLVQAPFAVKADDEFALAIGNFTDIFENTDHVALWGKREEQVTAHDGSSQLERSDIKFFTKAANFAVYFVTFYISRGYFGWKFQEENNKTTYRTSKFCMNEVINIDSVHSATGRAKSIGLSNFNQTQILNVYNDANIKPSDLHVESHAYFKQIIK